MSVTQPPSRVDLKLQLLSAGLVLSSFVVYTVAAMYHPAKTGNDYSAVFAVYASSAGWTADHVGWFVEYALLLCGILVLFYAIDAKSRMLEFVARLGVIFTGAAIVLSAVRYAVDGVVLKRAVDAWASAPDADKAALYASALTARWLEEATASYQTFVIGIAFLLLVVLIIWTGGVSRVVAYLLLPGAVGYLAMGWILGESGFAPQGAIPNYLGNFAPFFAALALLVSALLRARSLSARSNKPFIPDSAMEGGIVR